MSCGNGERDKCPLLKGLLLEPIPALRFLSTCDYIASAKLCLCVRLSSSVCVCVCACVYLCLYLSLHMWICAPPLPPNLVRLCLLQLVLLTCSWEQGWVVGSEFLEQVWAHLVVIGRRKKGPCVLGTGSTSLTQPSITQLSTVQNQPRQEKNAQLLPFTPPYLSWLLANSHNPSKDPGSIFFFHKQCSELPHSFHFNLRR